MHLGDHLCASVDKSVFTTTVLSSHIRVVGVKSVEIHQNWYQNLLT
jgi:hypothetical protein